MTHVMRFLPVAEPDVTSLEESYLIDAFRSGWISSLGEYIQKFETGLATYCGVLHAVAVCNGTVALDLALLATGIGPGDEVIVPSLTFVATAAAVRHVGATPVFIDSEAEIGTLDPELLTDAITDQTKAVIPVHLYGHPVDMDPVLKICEERGITIIEDAAEAIGASYKGRKVGSLGHAATFSFYGNKIITTGEGGAVVTNDPLIDQRVRFLRDHAMDKSRRYWHTEIGYNYRMTNLQAAIGCAQLIRIDGLISKRQQILEFYRNVMQDTEIQMNAVRSWAQSVPWLISALLPQNYTVNQRDKLLLRLRDRGIDSRPYFHLLSSMPPYKSYRTVGVKGRLVIAEELSNRGFNLPTVNWLSQDDIVRIKEEILSILSDV